MTTRPGSRLCRRKKDRHRHTSRPNNRPQDKRVLITLQTGANHSVISTLSQCNQHPFTNRKNLPRPTKAVNVPCQQPSALTSLRLLRQQTAFLFYHLPCPLAVESTDRTVCRHHPMARNIRRERVTTQRLSHCLRTGTAYSPGKFSVSHGGTARNVQQFQIHFTLKLRNSICRYHRAAYVFIVLHTQSNKKCTPRSLRRQVKPIPLKHHPVRLHLFRKCQWIGA